MAESDAKSGGRARRPSGERWSAGLVGGLFGGLVLGVWAAARSFGLGLGPLFPLRLAAASLLGTEALVGGAGIVVLGLLLHTLTAVLWGLLFAALVPRRTPAALAVVYGLLYGAGVLLVMTYLVLPVVDPALRMRALLIPGSWWFGHLLFGVTLACVPALERRTVGEPSPRLLALRPTPA
jgi:hypothetical protein